MPKKRDYDDEYRRYHGKPEQIKRRAARNKSVAMLDRKGKGSKDHKDVHHKDGNPLNRKRSNMAVISRSKNRGMK